MLPSVELDDQFHNVVYQYAEAVDEDCRPGCLPVHFMDCRLVVVDVACYQSKVGNLAAIEDFEEVANEERY